MPTNDRSGLPRRRRPAKPKPKNPAPEVIYTQPKPFNRRRLFLRLVTVLAFVLAIGLGMSIFFKVETVTVTGANKYSAWSVSEASGIEKGDSLIFFSRAGAAGKIIDAMPYIKSVRFSIELPGTVNIIIEESPVAYAVKAQDGTWWLISAEGRVVEKTDGATANECTNLIGITLQSPTVGEQAVAVEAEESDDTAAFTAADRLNAALLILQQLEENEILGQAASVNVTSMQSLELWYGTQYQVKLGDTARMDYKIAAMKVAINQMSQYQTGILDASFTTFPNSVSYMPFTD